MYPPTVAMPLDKRDVLSVAILALIFFFVAASGIGSSRTPRTTWRVTQPTEFTIDLGRPQTVTAARILVKRGKATLAGHTAASLSGPRANRIDIPSSYYSWSDPLILDGAMRFVRLQVAPDPGEVFEAAEIVLLGPGSARVDISSISVDGGEAALPGLPLPAIARLIDEQDLVRMPPSFAEESCFDEGYFVRTAENYLTLETPYEWTHPPLGKLILAFGVGVFGFSPFGWRIPGLIFATLMIPTLYVFGKRMFGSWIGAFTAAFLLTFDCMHFALARIGTVDTFLVTFSLLSQLCFYLYFSSVVREGWGSSLRPLFAAVVLFALACATKWLALYGLAGMLLLLVVLRLKRVQTKRSLPAVVGGLLGRPFSALPWFLGSAVFVYFLTYVPNMLGGKSLAQIGALQLAMYRYHVGMTATHPFSSPWWSWPLMLRPIWIYVEELPGEMKSTIVLLGNPVVWWTGFVAVLAFSGFALRALRRPVGSWSTRDLAAVFTGAAFFSQWLPYVLLSRVTFLFHFYACVPYLCLATAYGVERCWETRRGRVATVAFFALVVAVFVLFYPALSGSPAAISTIERLKWLGPERWEF